jgi:hypothetical protein
MEFAGWSSLAVGVLMLMQWGFFLATGSVPEVSTEPVALGFHLVAEAATAITLLSSGWMLVRRQGGVVLGLVANGMLIYTVIVSPGYFAQLGQWPLVGMFAALLVVAVANVIKLAGVLNSARTPAS